MLILVSAEESEQINANARKGRAIDRDSNIAAAAVRGMLRPASPSVTQASARLGSTWTLDTDALLERLNGGSRVGGCDPRPVRGGGGWVYPPAAQMRVSESGRWRTHHGSHCRAALLAACVRVAPEPANAPLHSLHKIPRGRALPIAVRHSLLCGTLLRRLCTIGHTIPEDRPSSRTRGAAARSGGAGGARSAGFGRRLRFLGPCGPAAVRPAGIDRARSLRRPPHHGSSVKRSTYPRRRIPGFLPMVTKLECVRRDVP